MNRTQIMETTAEYYWNIGYVVVWPMYLLSFIAVAVCSWGSWMRLPLYRSGKSLDCFDCCDECMKRFIGGPQAEEFDMEVAAFCDSS